MIMATKFFFCRPTVRISTRSSRILPILKKSANTRHRTPPFVTSSNLMEIIGNDYKLHALCDGKGRPLIMVLTQGQMSDFQGAAMMMTALPRAKVLLADRAYDAKWLREALIAKGITPCIPFPMMWGFIKNATSSKTCLQNSKTGGASQCAMTAVPIPSFQPSVSPQQSYFGSINES